MQLDEIQAGLATVTAIPVTPFDADGDVDFDRYATLVERMVDGGIRVVTPNGNTSEFYSLTASEQQAAVDATVAGVQGQALILAGVGYDARTAADMAEYAAAKGAQAVMVHQPVHPFKSDAGWIAYHATVAEAVPDLAIVPYLRDPSIGAATLTQLAEQCPNFVGIKFAVPDPVKFAATVATVGRDRLAWICGVAESWAPFFATGGACGFTSGLVNVTTGLSLELQAALESGNQTRAMELWHTVRPFEEIRARHNNGNNVSAVKEAMAQLGLCGATVRPPISELPDSEKAEVTQILTGLGVAVPA
ncbi:MAG: dihydrodipicolinate synthase family protein [Litorilinea sp.]